MKMLGEYSFFPQCLNYSKTHWWLILSCMMPGRFAFLKQGEKQGLFDTCIAKSINPLMFSAGSMRSKMS